MPPNQKIAVEATRIREMQDAPREFLGPADALAIARPRPPVVNVSFDALRIAELSHKRRHQKMGMMLAAKFQGRDPEHLLDDLSTAPFPKCRRRPSTGQSGVAAFVAAVFFSRLPSGVWLGGSCACS